MDEEQDRSETYQQMKLPTWLVSGIWLRLTTTVNMLWGLMLDGAEGFLQQAYPFSSCFKPIMAAN